MVKKLQILLLLGIILLTMSCSIKTPKMNNNLLYYCNYSEAIKIPINLDRLFMSITIDTFDVTYLTYDIQLKLDSIEKSFFLSEYTDAMKKFDYFNTESYRTNIFFEKAEDIYPIGQFNSSFEKGVRTLILLFTRKIEDTNLRFKNMVFFNIKNDSLRSVCSVSENTVESFSKIHLLEKNRDVLTTSYSTYVKNKLFFIKHNHIGGGIDDIEYAKEKIDYYSAYYINQNGFIQFQYFVKNEDFPEALTK